MEQTERNLLVAERIKMIMFGVDMLIDDVKISELKEIKKTVEDRASCAMGLSVITGLDKAEKAREEADLMDAIVKLCEVRKRQKDNTQQRADSQEAIDSLAEMIGI